MSTRRSARLSAASANVKEDFKNDSTTSEVANKSRKRKNETAETLSISAEAGLATPQRKKASRSILPPVTPPPTTVSMMSVPSHTSAATLQINRLAVLNGTNATLVTPETHRVVAAKPMDEISPSKASNVTTTANILEKALAHLTKVEPKLKPIIDKHHCHVFSHAGLAEEVDPFNSLVSGIISQQVSTTLYTIEVCLFTH
jgi:DNA-3-methyladenine glycosylase II